MTKPALAASLLVALPSAPPSLTPPWPVQGFCNSKCAVRCSKAGRWYQCLEYCRICCGKCHCVPSGTYGNKDECPCYRDMKSSKGQPKCP